MISGSCHCGAVSFVLTEHRDFLTECNCSICRRYAALWLHCDRKDIELNVPEDATHQYVWGQKLLAFHTCRTCGCLTHWSSTQADYPEPMAVNCRLAEPETVAGMPVRTFDGADTWQYLDD